MPLLPLITRDQLPDDLRPLWDDCERRAPAFRHLWSTMANSLDAVPLADDHDFPVRPEFSADDSLVVGFTRLLERFSPRQIEELTWRFTQCVAFNWHNEFLELDHHGD